MSETSKSAESAHATPTTVQLAGDLTNETWALLSQMETIQYFMTNGSAPVDADGAARVYYGIGHMLDKWVEQLEAIKAKLEDLNLAIPRRDA